MSKNKTTPTHVKDLQADPTNARRHTPRNIGTIVDALHEVGAARSIVIDEENQILAGNGTVSAAAEAGITKVQVVEADGNTLIAVRRAGLTPAQKRRLTLYDNRAAELAEWDPAQLRALDADGKLGGLWTPEELATMLEVDQAERIDVTKIERPTDVAWILVAIPLSEWPRHQAMVETLQKAALFTTVALRPKPKEASDGKAKPEK